MRYIARISPALDPLHAIYYGNDVDRLRDLLCTMPVGTSALVYERVEVHVKTFTKVKGENEDVVLEETILPTSTRGGVAPRVAEYGDESIAGAVATGAPGESPK